MSTQPVPRFATVPAVVFPQIRVAAASIAISLLPLGCGGTSLTPSEDMGGDDAPALSSVATTVETVVESDAKGTEPAAETTDANSDDETTEAETPSAAPTSTTSGASVGAATTTTAPVAPTTTAPSSTVAPPTTFELITEEPSSGPPQVETVEPNA
ncbi:MAG: hypothetical protein CMB31_06055 [Euryarchaeota archaeon]|nr:hypothetical protein [Euryarchaeota archaeon]